MAVLLTPNPPPSRKGPALETKLGNPIDNYQVTEISKFERNQFHNYERRYSGRIEIRSQATPMYNCHGLTFACRRSGIYDSSALNLILQDDAYKEIPPDQVLPGDIILYYGRDGDIEHSGIVVSTPRIDPLRIPLVVSKWGKYHEILHLANECDYNFSLAKYYRITT
ncbi:MAG: hypothetical protein HYY49_06285 [Ignavibacteriales bacterium]|nr:hypothetical protein [Ignavibacteriales bacterium]